MLRFEGLAHDAIIKLKFKGFRALAQPLAEQMYDYLKLDPLPVDVLIPVPLSRRRLRERGYNQSALLARELSRLVKLPVTDGVLVRSAYTRAQTEMMTAEERFKNVTDSFKCINIIGSRSVLLIDDVVTTGATLNACAGSLSKAGATSVWGLTVAREI